MARRPAPTKRARKQKELVVPISEARRRLFELVEDVLTGRRESVTLSHRDYDGQVQMVRTQDLDKLKADLAALRNPPGKKPLSLRGIATLHGDVEEIIAEIRAEDRRSSERMWREILAPAPAAQPDGAKAVDVVW